MMRSLPNGSITILHKEYIQDIAQTNGFFSNPFVCNPGLAQTFPWLSQIASAYEEYRIRGCVFTFKSTTTPYNQAQSSLGLGTVMMAAQYNVNNPLFTNKRDLENYIGSQSASPLQSQQYVLQPTGPLKTLYTRTGRPNDPNYDPRMYDFARFEIATTGMTPSSVIPGNPIPNENIGELWVTYEIDLIKPRFRNQSGPMDHYMLSQTATTGNIAISTIDAPFGPQAITAVTPSISATNWTNGSFGLGTYIDYNPIAFQTRLYFPESLANKLVMITIAVKNISGDTLANIPTEVQSFALTLPPGFPPCGALRDGFFARVLPADSSIIAPNTTIAMTGVVNQICNTFLFQLGSLVGPANTQFVVLKYTKQPKTAPNNASDFDIIVIEVDPLAFPIAPA